jgi:glycogen synthase
MRICLISKEYPPETGWGGIGAYTYQMAHALTDLGHDVEVVALAPENSSSGRHNSSVQVDSVGSRQIKVHRAAWEDELSDLRILRETTPFSHFVIKAAFSLWQTFLRRHEEQPFDVVEAPEHLADGVMPGASGAVPLVVKLHTPYSKFHAEQLHGAIPSFDHQLVCMLERITMLTADELCSPSEDMAKYVATDLGIPLGSIKIVRNPVNAEQFSPEGEIAVLPMKGPMVLLVGRLEERKGTRYLIEAVPQVIREFPDAHFVVVGSDTPHGPGGSALAHCQEILRQQNCLDSVTFIPHVELSRMPTYYRAADICVVPSLYDNAPYTCIEAMSCGKPVIGTTSGGTREYIEPERTGLLVPPKDSQAIASAVLRLLRNQEERRRYGEAARAYVLANLTNQAVATKMVALYEMAIANHVRREKAKFYCKDQASLLPDARELLRAYNQMYYDLLYQYSLRFRFSHWLGIAKKQPALFRSKVTIRLARPLARRFPKSYWAHLVLRLENSIRVHELQHK